MEDDILSRFDTLTVINNVDSINTTFNSISSTLIDPIIYDDPSYYDDGVRFINLEKGWNCKFEYTAEGSVGLLFDDLPKKNSGVDLGRMYYSSGNEPDYQIVARFKSEDQLFKEMHLNYDENTIVGTMYCYPRSFNLVYGILFVFKKVDGVILLDKLHMTFNNAHNFSNSSIFIYGYKDYNRVDNNYLYSLGADKVVGINSNTYTNIIGEIESSTIKNNIITPINIGNIGNLYNLNIIGYNPNDYAKIYNVKRMSNKIIKINDNKSLKVDFYNNHNTSTLFDYSFFVEGKTNVNNIYVKESNTNNANIFINEYNNHNNNYVDVKNIKFGEYKIVSGNYSRHFNHRSLPMIKGEITGNVNIINCTSNNMVIKCFREYDDYLIGQYEIINGVYTVPNLDVNTTYNIVLFDLTYNLESKILSHRTPTIIDNNITIKKYSPSSYYYIINNSILLKWNLIGYCNKFIIYKSTSPIDVNNLPQSIVETEKPIYEDKDFEYGNTYYYVICADYGDDEKHYSENFKVIT